jgi:transporter family protein
MNWIYVTLLAAGMETISSIYDRYILKNDLKKTDSLLIMWGYFAGLMFAAPALLTGSVTLHPWAIAIGALSAFLYLLAMHYYYKALNTGEVSRVVPILSINPVITLILATVFLGEIHDYVKYLGIALIMMGVLVHAIDHQHHRLINKKAIWWTLFAASCFALKNVMAKWLTIVDIDPLNVLFWIGAGLFLFNILVHIRVSKKLDLQKNHHILDVALAAVLAASVTLIYTTAIIIGPAALVAFLHRIEILFVFLISEAIDFFNPKLLREKFVKAAFYQKLFGVILVLIGGYLLI